LTRHAWQAVELQERRAALRFPEGHAHVVALRELELDGHEPVDGIGAEAPGDQHRDAHRDARGREQGAQRPALELAQDHRGGLAEPEAAAHRSGEPGAITRGLLREHRLGGGQLHDLADRGERADDGGEQADRHRRPHHARGQLVFERREVKVLRVQPG
jgi:hypothetical protein